jgi:hypothetical protein
MSGKTSPFLARLDAVAAETEALLDRLLTAAPAPGELARPARLIEAMRYASLGGGKRFRPFLVVESASLFRVPRHNALMAGAALECIHCYSLLHDDLPAMDNDELRRGQPTAHRKFDEATAILAGDGLLTFAFDVLSREDTHPDAAVRIELVSALSRAAGVGGMVGGQMLDLAAEGRFGPVSHGANEVRLLQRSAKPSKSPTIYWTSKAIRPWWANRPARTAPPGKPQLPACSALPAPNGGSKSSLAKPRPRSRRSGLRRRCWSRARILSPNGGRKWRPHDRDTKAIGPRERK